MLIKKRKSDKQEKKERKKKKGKSRCPSWKRIETLGKTAIAVAQKKLLELASDSSFFLIVLIKTLITKGLN